MISDRKCESAYMDPDILCLRLYHDISCGNFRDRSQNNSLDRELALFVSCSGHLEIKTAQTGNHGPLN